MSALYPVGGEFSIDGVSSDTWHCFYTAFHIPLLPTARFATPDIPGRAGKANAGLEWSSRAVTLDVVFANRPTLKSDILGLAAAVDPTTATAGTRALRILDDMPGMHFNVVPNADMPISPNPGQATFTLALEALDPYWYSDVPQHISAVPLASGGSVQLPNAGTAPANPVFTVTKPAGQSGVLTGVELTINGVSVGYAGVIAAGDTVVIDTNALTVTKNGVSDIANWIGDFPQLPPGGAALTYSDTNHVGANVVADYTERWS